MTKKLRILPILFFLTLGPASSGQAQAVSKTPQEAPPRFTLKANPNQLVIYNETMKQLSLVIHAYQSVTFSKCSNSTHSGELPDFQAIEPSMKLSRGQSVCLEVKAADARVSNVEFSVGAVGDQSIRRVVVPVASQPPTSPASAALILNLPSKSVIKTMKLFATATSVATVKERSPTLTATSSESGQNLSTALLSESTAQPSGVNEATAPRTGTAGATDPLPSSGPTGTTTSSTKGSSNASGSNSVVVPTVPEYADPYPPRPTPASCIQKPTLISRAGASVQACLNETGGLLGLLTPAKPGIYHGKLTGVIDGKSGDMPVELRVRAASVWVVLLMALGVLAVLVPRKISQQQRQQQRLRLAVAEAGLQDDDPEVRAGPYQLDVSPLELSHQLKRWVSWIDMADLEPEVRAIGYWRECERLYDMIENIWAGSSKPRSALNQLTQGLNGFDGPAFALILVEQVLEGEALGLTPKPINEVRNIAQTTSIVRVLQAEELRDTLLACTNLALTLQSIELDPLKKDIEAHDDCLALKTQFDALVRLLYRPFPVVVVDAKSLTAYLTQIQESSTKLEISVGTLQLRNTVGLRFEKEELTGLPDKPLVLQSTAKLRRELGGRRQMTNLVVGGVALLIALLLGIPKVYLAEAWGTTAWDYWFAFFWGATAGVASVSGAKIIERFSSSGWDPNFFSTMSGPVAAAVSATTLQPSSPVVQTK